MSEADFERWWNIDGEWVEEPNQRRNGWSGMMRAQVEGRTLFVKRQLNHQCRTWRHPLGWPTASREWHYLHRLHGLGIGAPSPVFHAARRSGDGVEAVLVTEELSGYQDLLEWGGLDGDSRSWLALAVGELLGRLHRARLQHSSLYDKHVMARREGERFVVALIDLEKMRPRLTAGMAAKHDLQQLRRRQRLFREEDWVGLRAAHAVSIKRREA